MEQPTIKVYARANERGQVDELLNTIFNTAEITNTDIFIDEGYGDAYAYPHTRFTLYDMQMRHNYKLVGGKLTATTDADKAQENNSMGEVEKAVPFSNPNLLINGGFDVWQRGDNFAIPNRIYTADRWWAQSADGSATGSGIFKHVMGMESRITTHRIRYTMEDIDFANIKDKQVTLSWSFNGIVNSETFVATNPLVFDKLISSGILNWVKLELGTVATPFVPRLYGEELALCQRYYQKINFGVTTIRHNLITHYIDVIVSLVNIVRTPVSIKVYNPLNQPDVVAVVNNNIKITDGPIEYGFTVLIPPTNNLVNISFVAPNTTDVDKPYLVSGLLVIDAEIY